MTASKDLAKEQGTYETYEGSPVSKGIFQYDMWGVTPSDRWDWASLKAEVEKIWRTQLIACCPNAYRFYFSNLWQQRMFRAIHF